MATRGHPPHLEELVRSADAEDLHDLVRRLKGVKKPWSLEHARRIYR